MWASQEEMPELSHQGASAWPTTDWGPSRDLLPHLCPILHLQAHSRPRPQRKKMKSFVALGSSLHPLESYTVHMEVSKQPPSWETPGPSRLWHWPKGKHLFIHLTTASLQSHPHSGLLQGTVMRKLPKRPVLHITLSFTLRPYSPESPIHLPGRALISQEPLITNQKA